MTFAKEITRRELLRRTFLGTQILLLASCGGDDEVEVEQPRAAPTAPPGSLTDPSREQEILTLAMLRRIGPIWEAIRQWNEGNVTGALDNVAIQDADLAFSTTGNLEVTQDAVAARPNRTNLCRHCARPDGL